MDVLRLTVLEKIQYLSSAITFKQSRIDRDSGTIELPMGLKISICTAFSDQVDKRKWNGRFGHLRKVLTSVVGVRDCATRPVRAILDTKPRGQQEVDKNDVGMKLLNVGKFCQVMYILESFSDLYAPIWEGSSLRRD